MATGVREARKALSRGDADEALVLLWNDVERARLAGDRRSLAAIEHAAGHIARHGDGSQRQDAERLLEALGRVGQVGAPVTAVARGEPAQGAGSADELGVDREPLAAQGEAPGPDGELQPGGNRRLSTILWLLFIAAVVLVNVLGGGRG